MGRHVQRLVVQLFVDDENIHKIREIAVAVNDVGIEV
jgi:hypothetical protein